MGVALPRAVSSGPDRPRPRGARGRRDGDPRVVDRLARVRPLSAVRSDVTWRFLVHALEKGALRITVRTQRGSLPVVLCTILVVLIAGPGVALVATGALSGIRIDRVADSPAQVVAAVLAVVSTIAAARAKRRIAAVLLVGGLGYAVAVIFALAVSLLIW